MSDIRLLSPEEIPFILPGAREFFAEKNLLGTLNEPHLVKSLKTHHAAGVGFILVCGNPPFRGAIAGAVIEDFATADRVCMEFFWYVRASERGSVGVRLLKAFEDEARVRQARRVVMMHLVDEKAEGLVKLYEKRDYILREQMFSKELEAPCLGQPEQ